MKASSLKVRSHSNIDDTADIEMSFDKKGQVKLAAILIDLYSDLWAAIIREYTANGWDSHVSAGQTRPVEVTLPTLKDPVFRVKDYGVGMSLKDIRVIYSKYGASTKDQDNEQIGSYGLGCKSALSVSPSFTVTAIKDGVKNVVIVSREENSLGKIKPVLQLETDEPNGVEISIAVDANISEFENKAKQVFFTWPTGSVLVNGKPPVKSVYDTSEFLHLGNGAYMSHERSTGFGATLESRGLLVNMGGIGYPVDEKQYSLLLDTAQRNGAAGRGTIMQHKLVLNIPLGSVDLVPSREGIRWTQKSTNTVVAKLKETLALVVSSIQKKIDVVDKREDLFNKDIFDLGKSFPSYFTSGDLTWKNEKFPGTIYFEKAPKSGEIENDCASTYHQGRIHRRYESPRFNFGFNGDNGSIQIKGLNSNHHYFFIDCEKTDATILELGNHAKSLMKARHVFGSSVTVIYMVSHSLRNNPWLQAAIANPETNAYGLTVAELIEESKAYRKEQSRLNRSTKAVEEPKYTVSRLVDSDGYRQRKDVSLTAPQMAELIAENPKLQVFADETIFTVANKEYAKNAMFFVPEEALIVYMWGARKASTFAKRVKFPVRTDLAQFLADAMVEKIEQVDFKDYFYELHMSHDMCNFGRRLDLPEGFLRECFDKKYSGYGETRVLLNHMNIMKQVDGAVFPEIPYVIKSREIAELGALLFEDPQPWSMSTRSEGYKKQMKIYLSSISDKIDMIVNS